MFLFSNIVALIGLGLASLEDLKTREVPDWLSFCLIFIGIGSSLIFAISQNNRTIFTNSVAGLLVGIAFGCMMYYTAQWGGGDAKLLMGMGALIGLPLTFQELPTLFLFIINLFVVGAAYGLFWSFLLAIKNWKKFKKHFAKKLHSPKIIMIRKFNLIVVAILLIAIIYSEFHIRVLLFFLMLLIYSSLYIWLFVKCIEDCCMIKTLDVSKLTEGDWIIDTIKIKGKLIYNPEKELGAKKEHIKKLKELKKQKLIKTVTVKEGVPFVPSFFLAYVFTLVVGNWLF